MSNATPERNRQWGRQLPRRRLLRGAGLSLAGVGIAGLVGCAGEDGPSQTATATTTGTTTATGTATAQVVEPKRGGTLTMAIAVDPSSLDFFVTPATETKRFTSASYSRLFKYRGSPGTRSIESPVVGDLAESAETADGQHWTVKLKPGVRFHNVDPVSGREVTTEDVQFSWDRATSDTGVNRASFAFVQSIEYPDDRTITFTLDAPNAAFLDFLADANLLWVQPREAGSAFDPSLTAIGSGPWIFKEYRVGSEILFERNPNWYEEGYPLLDEVRIPIIPEYANSMAQFQSGSLDIFSPRATDLLSLRDQVEGGEIFGDLSIGMHQWYFDGDPAAPWRDARVRQAMSMSLDRAAILDLAYEIKNLAAAGVDVRDPWNNVVPAGHSLMWLDPRSEDHGPSGKSFSYDPDEAARLLDAAGYPDGFTTKYQYTGNGYGSQSAQIGEAQAAYLNAIGIQTEIEVQDYASSYYTQTYRGNFTGVAWGPESSFAEPGMYPLRQFTPNALNKSRAEDPILTDLALGQQRELDPERRREMFHEIQRYHATQMYLIPSSYGGGMAWTMTRPEIKNVGGAASRISYLSVGESAPYYWKDV